MATVALERLRGAEATEMLGTLSIDASTTEKTESPLTRIISYSVIARNGILDLSLYNHLDRSTLPAFKGKLIEVRNARREAVKAFRESGYSTDESTEDPASQSAFVIKKALRVASRFFKPLYRAAKRLIVREKREVVHLPEHTSTVTNAILNQPDSFQIFAQDNSPTDKLGSGAQGEVYRVSMSDLTSQNTHKFAVKYLTSSPLKTSSSLVSFDDTQRHAHKRNSSSQANFYYEELAMMDVNHPNVVRPAAVSPNHLVMPLATDSLSNFMQKTPLSCLDTLSILEQISSGLVAVHEKGIVHRDIKEANVLLFEHKDPDDTSYMTAKIADFGLCAYVGDPEKTRVAGSLIYTPPEGVQTSYAPTTSFDIWSFGIMASKMLSGVDSPFVNEFRLPRGSKGFRKCYKDEVLSPKRDLKEAFNPKLLSATLSKAKLDQYLEDRPRHQLPLFRQESASAKEFQLKVAEELIVPCLHPDPSKRPTALEINQILLALIAEIPEDLN